ncbi:MAG: chemotaxis protein CheW [Candidatus Omnitrophota bacterium]
MQESEEKREDRQILTFNLLKEEMGLDIEYVHEVLIPQDIHPLPQAPDFVDGVINLRGRIIAVIDLRKKFNIKAIEDNSKMRIIICRINKFIVGLVVDSVSEVLSLPLSAIQPTPEVLSIQINAGYISGIARLGERVITILNLEEILTNDEITRLSKINR